MPDDLLNRLLYAVGFGTLGVLFWFGFSWADTGWGLRVLFVAAVATAAVGIGLDVRDRARLRRTRPDAS